MDQPHFQSPTIFIEGKVTPGREESSNDLATLDELVLVLVDSWWKILILSLTGSLLLCLCCYLSRCCYLCWDCCTDSFWGCCPRCRSWEHALLLKCCKDCNKKKKQKKDVTYYQVCDVIEEAAVVNIDDDEEEVEEEEEESLPQVYDTHYFNVMSVFKGGRGRYDLQVQDVQQRKQQQKLLSSSSVGRNDKRNDGVVVGGKCQTARGTGLWRSTTIEADAAKHNLQRKSKDDETSVKCHKYSQTDLRLQEEKRNQVKKNSGSSRVAAMKKDMLMYGKETNIVV